jgi:hypothetical protein
MKKDWKKCPKDKTILKCWASCRTCGRIQAEPEEEEEKAVKIPVNNTGRVFLLYKTGGWADSHEGRY